MAQRIRLPEHCGTLAGHTSRKVTLDEPGNCRRSATEFTKNCSGSGDSDQKQPTCFDVARNLFDINQVHSMGQSRSNSAEFCRAWPKQPASTGRCGATNGKARPNRQTCGPNPNRPKLAGAGQCLTNVWPMMVNFGQGWSNSTKGWQHLALIGQVLHSVGQVGQIWAKSRRLEQCPATVGELQRLPPSSPAMTFRYARRASCPQLRIAQVSPIGLCKAADIVTLEQIASKAQRQSPGVRRNPLDRRNQEDRGSVRHSPRDSR